jgi:8-hydroxy-5-deazaflavin:NADPH oxidoreductase
MTVEREERTMEIAIIGTGRMARQLGIGWARAGHQIIFGSRNPQSKESLVQAVGDARVSTPVDAIATAPVVVLAMPYTAVAPFVQTHAEMIRDRLVIDISNPFEHLPDNRIGGAEVTAQAIGSGARVVAAFKATFWQTVLEPNDHTHQIVRDVHYVGDTVDDKQIVAFLIEALGFRPVDCGLLRNAHVLDAMVPLMLELDRRYADGKGKSSWKFLG